MRTIALLAAAAFAASASAQPAKEPAKPAAQEAPKAEAPKADAVAKAEPRKHRKANPRRQEDARHCLDKPSNTEIIKCAEAYL
jgi:Ni/Co efflux regulator RcnB